MVECPMCDHEFGAESNMKIHRGFAHGGNTADIDMSECPTCGRDDFDDLRAMAVHHSQVHPDSYEDRLWHQADVGDADDCWVWNGHVGPDGYGQIGRSGDIRRSHREAYRIANGEPAENHVCHHCDNPLCINPNHLYDGTDSENQIDAVKRGQSPTGEDHYDSELTEGEVIQIRELYDAGGVTQMELANQFGVCRQTISKITRRITWKYIDG